MISSVMFPLLHTLSPTNDLPNTVFAIPQILPAIFLHCDPLNVSPSHLCSALADNLNANARGLCSLPLLISAHLNYHNSAVINPCSVFVFLPSTPEIYTWYSIQYVHEAGVHYGYFFSNFASSKFNTDFFKLKPCPKGNSLN